MFTDEWSCEWKYTKFNNDGESSGKKNAIYLDRHAPDCGNGKGINSFQLERNVGHPQYRYRYLCCTTQLPCTNEGKENDYTDEGASLGDPFYLDRQNVNCEDQLLTFFIWCEVLTIPGNTNTDVVSHNPHDIVLTNKPNLMITVMDSHISWTVTMLLAHNITLLQDFNFIVIGIIININIFTGVVKLLNHKST